MSSRPHEVVGHRGHYVAARLGAGADTHHLLRVAQPVMERQFLAEGAPVRGGVRPLQHPVPRDVKPLRAVDRLRGGRCHWREELQRHGRETPVGIPHGEGSPVVRAPRVRRQRTHVDEVRVLPLGGVQREQPVVRPDLRRPRAGNVDVDRLLGSAAGCPLQRSRGNCHLGRAQGSSEQQRKGKDKRQCCR